MENNNNNRMQKIKDKIDSSPQGSASKSRHYWCVTCKKFFILDKPQCPYMTSMCVNTPIAVENFPPENSESLEKFGLFYPKIPQKILSHIIDDNFAQAGINMASTYINFLKEWKFDLSKEQPLQSIKSFIILISGCETAQRVNKNSVTFVLLDASKLWEQKNIKKILLSGLNYLKKNLYFEKKIDIDFIDIVGQREVGKYYCAKCGMFFEFGLKHDSVTCPLMAQKCMFKPQNIENVKYSSDKLLKQFEITPDIYKQLIKSVSNNKDFSSVLKNLLIEWKINENYAKFINLLS